MNNWCLVTFNNWGIAQNFSSGSIVLVCCCGFWYCNQHSLGTLLVLEITASVKPSVLTQILYLAQLSKILAPRGKTSQWNTRMMMRRERFSKGYHSTSNRNWILLTANLNLVKRDFPPPLKNLLLVYCRGPSKNCTIKILEGSCLLFGLSSGMSCLSLIYLHSSCSVPKTVLLHIFFISLEFLERWTYGWIMD